MYLVCRNDSNASAALSRSRIHDLVLGRDVLVDALDLVPDPVLLLGVEHVAVLDADGAAVGVAEHAEDLAESDSLRG